MATFPSTPIPRIGSGQKTKYIVLKTSFEANYLQVRKGSTRGRKVFILNYNSITDDEFETLQSFFDANIGNLFDFVHPKSNETFVVTFQNDELEFTHTTSNRGDTKIILEGI
jgi:hypothetical protein